MSNPLNIQLSDDVLNNIITNNPFYINITGSVNICLVRCGQEIEKCNEVNFSTMTNYGKILVLNPNKIDKAKCNIKLAFDSTNDSLNDEGMSNYTFQKAFFTVPSLHRLNGQIYDMETFLVFSSVQKNGTILYVCICALSNATTNVKSNDWKLLNYKLMDELFVKNNKVPDVYGTSSINGVPNPIDLNNFIPIEGLRNFYDYTNPNNTNVNIRVYQTPMAVSNELISLLKSKLTPGSTYESFKNAIVKSINPTENLYFYFSQDLTDNYKSFAVNNLVTNEIDNKENFVDKQTKIEKKNNIENINDDKNNQNNQNNQNNDKYSKNTETDNKVLNKLDVENDLLEKELINKKNKNDKNKNNDDNDDNDKDKNKETYKNNDNISNLNITYIIIFFIFFFFMSFLTNKSLINFYEKKNDLSEQQLHENFSSDITENIISDILSNRFKMNSNLLAQAIVLFIILMLSISYMSNLMNKESIYNGLIFMSVIMIITVIFSIYYNLSYIVAKIYKITDDNIGQKEDYYFNKLFNKIYKSNNLSDTLSYTIKSFFPIKMDFSKLVHDSVNAMTGGFNVVPGSNNDNKKISSEEKIFSESIKNYSGISGFYDFISKNKNTILPKVINIKYGLFGCFALMIIGFIIFLSLFFSDIFSSSTIYFNIYIIFYFLILFIIPITIFFYYITSINLNSTLNKIIKFLFLIILVFIIIISTYSGLRMNNKSMIVSNNNSSDLSDNEKPNPSPIIDKTLIITISFMVLSLVIIICIFSYKIYFGIPKVYYICLLIIFIPVLVGLLIYSIIYGININKVSLSNNNSGGNNNNSGGSNDSSGGSNDSSGGSNDSSGGSNDSSGGSNDSSGESNDSITNALISVSIICFIILVLFIILVYHNLYGINLLSKVFGISSLSIPIISTISSTSINSNNSSLNEETKNIDDLLNSLNSLVLNNDLKESLKKILSKSKLNKQELDTMSTTLLQMKSEKSITDDYLKLLLQIIDNPNSNELKSVMSNSNFKSLSNTILQMKNEQTIKEDLFETLKNIIQNPDSPESQSIMSTNKINLLTNALAKMKEQQTKTKDFVQTLIKMIDNTEISSQTGIKENKSNNIINELSKQFITNKNEKMKKDELLQILKQELSKSPIPGSKNSIINKLINEINNLKDTIISKHDFIKLLKDYITSNTP
jgi:hypothetical protein